MPVSGLKERLNRGMLSVRPTAKFSPHMLMGRWQVVSGHIIVVLVLVFVLIGVFPCDSKRGRKMVAVVAYACCKDFWFLALR